MVEGSRHFGRYRVTRTLGEGAMGEVYEAVDEALGREVAVKTLKSRSGAFARVLDDRFRQEARTIAQLSHPNVVQLFDLDLSADPPFLVLERVAGPSLDERIAGGPLPISELVPLGIQIARALAAAHAANIVHRDVKPANILAAGGGMWKLADFGVAHVPDSSLTITGQFVGSPAYAAPEALVKGIAAAAGDVFALGATLYEAAAGAWPRAEAKGAVLAPVPPLAQRAPYVPAAIAAAIDRAVSFEPEARPTASELALLLAHSSTDAGTPRPTPAHRSRWWLWPAGAALLLIIGVAIGSRGRSDHAGGPPAVDDQDDEPNEHAARDWQHIQDEIAKGHYDGARHQLDEWEDRNGVSDESRAVRAQLDALGPERHGHGKHKN